MKIYTERQAQNHERASRNGMVYREVPGQTIVISEHPDELDGYRIDVLPDGQIRISARAAAGMGFLIDVRTPQIIRLSITEKA